MKDGPETGEVKTGCNATNGDGGSCDMRSLTDKTRNPVTTLVAIVGEEVAAAAAAAGDNALPLGGTLTAALLDKRDGVADTNGEDGSKNGSKANKNDNRDKIFVCSICNRCFGYKHVLQNPERTHTGEKPFECPECHKRFTRDHHLKTHMRLHTGEKPYQCSHCDRHFVQVANLRRHLRVHTGERPYACQTCTSRFSDSNQLKAHMLIHRGEKPFQCQVCLGRFRRRHHLIHHKCPKDEANLGKPRRGRRPKAYDQLTSDVEDHVLLDNNNSSSEQDLPQENQASPHGVLKNRRKPTHTIRILTPQQRELFLRDKVSMQTQAIDMSLSPSSERPLAVIMPRTSRFNSVEGVLDLSSSRSDSEGEPVEEEEEVHEDDDVDDEEPCGNGRSSLGQLTRLMVEPVNGDDTSNHVHINGEHSSSSSSSSEDGCVSADKPPNGALPIAKKASLATA